jgi:hypothetical protein
MLQSALYAAERMSHAIWISHAINLVIIGESSLNRYGYVSLRMFSRNSCR